MDPTITYLDHAASTPVRPVAVDAMLPLLTEVYANPSGAHRMSRDARRRIDDARDVLGKGLGCQPGEVVFTGSGTEADNLAVLGTGRRGTVVCSAVEHHAVLHPVEHRGGRVAPVDRDGLIDLDALAGLLDAGTSLVSVMLVNNETGMIQPLAAVAELVRDAAPNALLHTDAIQAFEWLDVATLAAPADLISVSAHKFGGPKGVGALVVRDHVSLDPQLLGGGQERGLRSGTHNSPGIVGMGAAAAETLDHRTEVVDRVTRLRDRLADGLLQLPGVIETGRRVGKIAGSCHLCFEGIEAEALLVLLERDGLCASAASSCSSGAQEPSHVLAAMGIDRQLALGSLRLSLGYCSTEGDVDRALELIPPAVERLRSVGS